MHTTKPIITQTNLVNTVWLCWCWTACQLNYQRNRQTPPPKLCITTSVTKCLQPCSITHYCSTRFA